MHYCNRKRTPLTALHTSILLNTMQVFRTLSFMLCLVVGFRKYVITLTHLLKKKSGGVIHASSSDPMIRKAVPTFLNVLQVGHRYN